MRERTLLESVRRHLSDGERPLHVVHMWTRHRMAVPLVAGAFAAFAALAWAVEISGWGARIALGLAGAAVAAMATTEYRILTLTDRGLVLLRSSRIRQKATDTIARLPADTRVEVVGDNLVFTDWEVGGVRYSVMRRFQAAMSAIADR